MPGHAFPLFNSSPFIPGHILSFSFIQFPPFTSGHAFSIPFPDAKSLILVNITRSDNRRFIHIAFCGIIAFLILAFPLFILISFSCASGLRGAAPGRQFPWYEDARAANPHKHWICMAKCVRFLTSRDFRKKAYITVPSGREKAYIKIGFPGRIPP